MLQHMDLFSGIGGFADALEATGGFKTVALCEIEEYCQVILRKHRPDVPIFQDVRNVHYDGSVDIITGGYPCQPFSLAGKRQGSEDDRHPWPPMFDLVRKHRPTWVIGENVAGHITMGLDDVLADLGGEGYSCRAFGIPACAVDARHRRQRVWIVAYRQRAGLQGYAGHGDGGGEPGRIAQGQDGSVGAGRICGDVSDSDKINDVGIRYGAGEVCGERSPAPEILRSEDVADPMRNRRDAGRGSDGEYDRAELDADGKHNRSEDVADPAGTGSLPAAQSGICGREESRRAWYEQFERQGRWPAEPGVGRVAHGVPDRIHRIKALGNAIVPQVAHRIALAILKVEAQYA